MTTETTIGGSRTRNPCRINADNISVDIFFQGNWVRGYGASRNDSSSLSRAIFQHYNGQNLQTCSWLQEVTSEQVDNEMTQRLIDGLFVESTKFRANADTITRLTMFKDNFVDESEDHEGITFTTAAGMTVMFQSANEINEVLKKLSAYSAAVMAAAARLTAMTTIPSDFRSDEYWPDPGTGALPQIANPTDDVTDSGFSSTDDDDDSGGSGSGSGSSGSGGTTS